MSEFKCPFAEYKVLMCDDRYALDEMMRQWDPAFAANFAFVNKDNQTCRCEPELCPRYTKYLIQNVHALKKMKENGK